MDRWARSLPLHLGVLVAVVACAALGWWQLDRARDQHAQSERPATNASLDPVPLESVLTTGDVLALDDVGRPVTVTGRYDGSHQLLVPGRQVGEAVGSLVLAPLVRADGAAVIVVRGWIPADQSVPPPPPGEQTVTGWLGPSDPAPDPEPLPTGEVGSIYLPALVNLVPYGLVDGFVADAAAGEDGTSLVALPAPVRLEGGTWPLQNLFYAAEWWIFGLAAIGFWVATVRRQRSVTPAATPGSRSSVRM